MSIGVNICRLRQQVGLTQEELADKVGVARSTVTQWERGISAPRMGRLARIAEALGVDELDLIGTIKASGTSGGLVDASVPLFSPADGADVPGEGRVEVPRSVILAHPRARAIPVGDDAMDRVLPMGMVAVFDPDVEPSNGQIAVLRLGDGGPTMRRWYRGESTTLLVAESHARHNDIVVREGDACKVLGVVVWTQSRELLA